MRDVPFVGLLQAGLISRVLWDFDGVIANTEPVQAHAYEKVLERRGIQVPDDFFKPLIGRTEPEIWRRLAHDWKIDEDIARLRSERIVVLLELAAELSPNWFVVPLLTASPMTRHEVISSGNVNVVEELLDVWALRPFFERISAFDPRHPVMSKQHQYEAAVTAAGAGDRVLVIEDNPAYLQAAREIGARTLGVRHSLNHLQDSDADALVDT